MSGPIPIFCAIDTSDLALAQQWAKAAVSAGLGLKFGKEFFTAHGPAEVRRLRPEGTPLFLDLKFHDIPNTVAGGIKAAAAAMRPTFITVHASGGGAMLRAARQAAEHSSEYRPGILAVTVLTSLDDHDLLSIGIQDPVEDQVVRLAELASGCGADGIVCAATEIATLRSKLKPHIQLVVPGIRPKGSAIGDQKRIMTPEEAFKAGANWLVIGRPITQANDPAAAAQAIAHEIAALA